jgi:hypothetical protein
MYMIIFIASVAVAALAFEIMNALTESAMGRGRLADFRVKAVTNCYWIDKLIFDRRINSL